MGHSIGVNDSYNRFSEEQMLENYLQGIEYLTVNQNIVLINKSIKQQSEFMQQSSKGMDERYNNEIDILRKEMESRFNQILLKIDVEKVIQRKIK